MPSSAPASTCTHSTSQRIRISEVFGPTIQGEGVLVGRPTVFVRTGGCDFRCAWCDTLYAVLPEFRSDWEPLTAEEILTRVSELTHGQPILVTLSGGNPALQPLEELLAFGRERGFSFALETQGSVVKEWFAYLDFLTLSPKPPSSQMGTNWERVRACVETARQGEVATQVSMKIVIFDEADYGFALEARQLFPDVPFVLQAGNPEPAQPENGWRGAPQAQQSRRQIEWLLKRATRDGWLDALILPQLHVLLWGNERGV
jgi:7-carboxy-7-deazaguanine synthase